MANPAPREGLAPAPFLDAVAEGPPGGGAYWLTTRDGTRIRMGTWPAAAGEVKGTILMFPGRTEYIEKYGRLAADARAAGYAMVAMDWRGQGLADRPLPRHDIGHVLSFDEYREDVDAMRAALPALDLPGPLFLIGHSMGGCIGLRALHDGLPVAAAVFSAPMWGIDMHPAMRAVAPAMLRVLGPLGFGTRFAMTTGPFEPMDFHDNPLTTDKDQFDYMSRQVAAHPELELGGPSNRWVQAALDETADLMRRPAPDMPTLTFLGTRERIVEPSAIHNRMKSWPKGRFVILPGAEHEVLMEAPERRQPVLDDIFAFFDSHR